MPSWITIKIPEDLSKEVESFLRTKQGKSLGYPTKTQFFAESIRESLQKHTTKRSVETKVLEEIGMIHREIDGYTSKIDEVQHFVRLQSFILDYLLKEKNVNKTKLSKYALAWKKKHKLKNLEITG